MAVVLGIASLALVPHSASLYGRARPHVAAARMAITLEESGDGSDASGDAGTCGRPRLQRKTRSQQRVGRAFELVPSDYS